MNVFEEIKRAFDSYRWGEEPVVTFDPPTDLHQAAALLSEADNWVKAARHIQYALRFQMASAMGERAGVRFGNQIYRTTPEVSYKVKPEHRSDFFAWVCEKRERVERLFNPNQARIGGLKSIAEEWVDTETGEIGWDAFRDAFLDVEVSDPKLTIMPTTIKSAPKFLVEAEEGKVIR